VSAGQEVSGGSFAGAEGPFFLFAQWFYHLSGPDAELP